MTSSRSHRLITADLHSSIHHVLIYTRRIAWRSHKPTFPVFYIVCRGCQAMGEVTKEDKMGNFSVVLDMNCFRLSEMSVKLIDGSVVVVEAKHPERPDKEYGSISRHFLHRYRLPSDIDPGSLISDLSDEGILTITAKKEGDVSTSSHTNSEEVLMEVDETLCIIDNYEHPNPGTFYTVTRVPGKDCPELLSEQLSGGCECGDMQCTVGNGCSCLRSGRNYAVSDGVLVLMEDRFGDVPVFECNFRCRCFENVVKYWNESGGGAEPCRNRCVQFGPSRDLQIFDAGKKGLGLRATRRIPSGAFVCEYAGEVIGLEEAKNRQERSIARGDMNYIFILREHFTGCDDIVTCVDPTHVGNIGRYINHSCQPNAGIVPVRVNDMVPWLCVFARSDIREGEEICFDYSGSSGGGATGVESRKACLCGARGCRKWLPFQIV